MPLQPLNLDDRTFDELLAEARVRIARYCPEWTDFNDSDPGMALVQLFAWLTDLMIYKLNQVPERNVTSFLQLLNLEQRPARPAHAQVVFERELTAKPQPETVPIRTKFFVSADSGELTFETLSPIELSPYPLDAVQTFDGVSFENATATNKSAEGYFFPFGAQPQQGNALYLGFQAEVDPPATPDAPGPKAAFPGQLVLYFFAPPVQETATWLSASETGQTQPTLVWEYQSVLDAAPGQRRPPKDTWRQLAIVSDDTESLTREGRVVIRAPGEDCVCSAEPRGDDDVRRFWIRCRLAQETYDQKSVPRVAMVRINVVEIENRATHEGEFLGEGDGRRIEFQLQNLPVDAASLEIVVNNSDNVSEAWTKKDDMGNATPSDSFYTLDAATGVVRFGDGKHGRIPPPQHFVFARTYRAGGGAGGNIRAGTIQDPPATVRIAGLTGVTNPRPAVDGEDEESFDDLRSRVPRILRGDSRAITDDDYRRHAEETPGVGRAIVVPLALPQHPGLTIPGAMTVVVIPRAKSPSAEGAPVTYRPSHALLDQVKRRLNERRPTCVELAIASPRYRDIMIDLVVTHSKEVTERQAIDGVRRAIEDYFCPVPRPVPKPSRQCPPQVLPRWEIGDPIRFSRLYEVVLSARDEAGNLPVVRDVNALNIEVEGMEQPVGKPLLLDPDELPACRVTIRANVEQSQGAAR